MAKIIAIYSRKSKFTGAGESIDNQIELCQEYAKQRLQEPCRFLIYEDEGFSGKNTERPEFQKMLSDMRQGKFETLMCYRLDRISRSVSDFSAILEELTAYHVDFVSIRENFDTSTPIGRAMIYIASVFAELERETIAERIRDNKYKLYRTGRWQGGFAPVGLKTCKVQGMDEDGHKRSYFKLELDEETAPHVKMLFDEFTRLGSLSRLENHLLKNHILTLQGKEYRLSVLRQIMSNPVYAKNDQDLYNYLSQEGCDLANDQEEYDGRHSVVGYGKTKTVNAKQGKRARSDIKDWIIAISPHQGIVTGGQWVAVQKKITDNAEKYPRSGTSSVSLLSGLIRCGKCGAPMVVKGNTVHADGTPGFTYKCRRKDRSSGELCGVANLPGVHFDKMVVTILKELFLDTGEVSTMLNGMFEKIHVQQSELEKEIKALQSRISGSEGRLENLTLKLADSKSADLDQTIYAAMKKLKDEIDMMREQLESLLHAESAHHVEQYNLEAVRAEITSFCKSFDLKEVPAQREALKTILKQVTWFGDDFEIELYGGKVLETQATPAKVRNFSNDRYRGDDGVQSQPAQWEPIDPRGVYQ